MGAGERVIGLSPFPAKVPETSSQPYIDAQNGTPTLHPVGPSPCFPSHRRFAVDQSSVRMRPSIFPNPCEEVFARSSRCR